MLTHLSTCRPKSGVVGLEDLLQNVLACGDEVRSGFDLSDRLTRRITTPERQCQPLDDAARRAAEDDQVRRQKYGFFYFVGDQEDRLFGLLPDIQQQFLRLFPDKRIQSAERLIQQQNAGIGGQARAMPTRCF